ncbi:hypothetical protein [Kaistella sp.]|uniref:hypothetical protein n=1 Tax=Kaistella sp. TaxID=2782235 RepID=UPI0035A0EDA1
MSKETQKDLAKKYLQLQEKNRERQRAYRERKKQSGYKQVAVFVSEYNPAPVKKLIAEWENYQSMLPKFEKTIRELSKNLTSDNKPSPKRDELAQLADFLKRIIK